MTSQKLLYHEREIGAEITRFMEVLLDIEGLEKTISFLIDVCLRYVLYNEFCAL